MLPHGSPDPIPSVLTFSPTGHTGAVAFSSLATIPRSPHVETLLDRSGRDAAVQLLNSSLQSQHRGAGAPGDADCISFCSSFNLNLKINTFLLLFVNLRTSVHSYTRKTPHVQKTRDHARLQEPCTDLALR